MKSLLVLIVLTISLLSAAQPHAINFQGILTNPDGSAVVDTTYSFLFSLFDAEVAGNKLWSETQVVATQGGVYQVTLGSVSSLELLPFNQPYYVQIAVNSTALPLRTKLVTTPYAISANRADIALTAMRADTASFASTAATAGSAAVAGRALLADTASFATSAGSAITAMTAGSAATASIAAKADTANFALVALSTVSGTADSALIAASAYVAQSVSTGAAVTSINGLTDGITIKTADGTLEITQVGNEIIIGSDPFAHGVKVEGPCDSDDRTTGSHSLDAWNICIDPDDKDLYLYKGKTTIDFVLLGQAAYARERNEAWDAASILSLSNETKMQLNAAKILVNESTIESLSSADVIQDQSLSVLSSVDGAMTTRIVTNENAISDLVDSLPVLKGRISDNSDALVDSILSLRLADESLLTQINTNISSPWIIKDDTVTYSGKVVSNKYFTIDNKSDSLFAFGLLGQDKNGVERNWSLWNMTDYNDHKGTFEIWQYADNDKDGFHCRAGDDCGPRFVISKEGNVGIGTHLPTAKLHVNGSLSVGDIIQENTTGLTYGTGFQKYDDIYQAPSYYKDRSHKVHLSGLVGVESGPVISTGSWITIGTVSSNYRPSHRRIFVARAGLSIASTTSEENIRVDIVSSGEIIARVDSGTGIRWISLEGISYRVD